MQKLEGVNNLHIIADSHYYFKIRNCKEKNKIMKSIKMLMMAVLSIAFFSLSAQDTTTIRPIHKKMVSHKVFSCPMHTGKMSDKPGKCAICGMALKKTQTQYTCSMHSKVKSNKPGKCPACGMPLTPASDKKMKMNAKKMNAKKIYTCPMHADVTSKKQDKCSKCGMDMMLTN